MTTDDVPSPAQGLPPRDEDRAFFGHPKGLQTLFATEFWERYSFYGMRGLLVLFLTDTAANHGLHLSDAAGNSFYGVYNSLVYLMAVPGGWIADRIWGARRSVLWGGIIIALGHCVMAIPTSGTAFLGLGLIVLGTGLLKPNISAQVGGLFHEHDKRRDAGFTVFYMAINMGAFLAPLTAGWVGQHVNYHLGFGCAAIGMTFAVVWYIVEGKHLGTVGLRPPKPITGHGDRQRPQRLRHEAQHGDERLQLLPDAGRCRGRDRRAGVPRLAGNQPADGRRAVARCRYALDPWRT